jgi:hypothetical protein
MPTMLTAPEVSDGDKRRKCTYIMVAFADQETYGDELSRA